ncbi:MAG: hypothetical protein U0S48_10385 [Solirubrobacteraceae bacterium]
MADRHELPVGVRAEPHPLDRRRPVAGEREHLLAGDRELHRAAGDLGGERGEHCLRARCALRAEAATDVLGHDAHALLGQTEHLRQRRQG